MLREKKLMMGKTLIDDGDVVAIFKADWLDLIC